jgi:PIN domain nuclease of toxin-antitoxin system/antitoxin (DNA-binding transcriptional repressor) of toxin-antitoxin stability system
MTVNIFEAKTQLSKLIQMAENGEDVVIARAGKPVVRLTRLEPVKKPIVFGLMKGKIHVSDDFDDPLPPEVLDTHVLLWLMEENPRLRRSARSLIEDASEVYVSSASLWEIAIKWRLRKIEEDPQTVLDQLDAAGLKELQVTNRHAVATGKLPLLHNDPFDRLLVAQAITEPMRLLTSDDRLLAYSELVIRV